MEDVGGVSGVMEGTCLNNTAFEIGSPRGAGLLTDTLLTPRRGFIRVNRLGLNQRATGFVTGSVSVARGLTPLPMAVVNVPGGGLVVSCRRAFYGLIMNANINVNRKPLETGAQNHQR